VTGRLNVTPVSFRMTAMWVLVLALAVAVLTTPRIASAGQDPTDSTSYGAVLDRYCVVCHNERLQRGSLALDVARIDEVGADAAVWEKVLQKLQTQSMPPPGRPRPDAADYSRFASWLETALDDAAAAAPNPGRPTIHRLNRLEYTNAVRDLLGVEIDAQALLPGDDLAYGFDNNADMLTIAPGLLERYISAARAISRLAVEDPSFDADVARFNMAALDAQDGRMSEELPFGSRGGAAVRHHFPLDAEYAVSLRLGGNVREPQELDVRLDGARVALLSVGRWPEDEESGRQVARMEADGAFTVRFPATAGPHTLGVSFVKRAPLVEGVAPSRLPVWTFGTGRGFIERMTLDSVEIAGPYAPDTVGGSAGDRVSVDGRPYIFGCRPTGTDDEERCADQILAALARRAYRRPVSDDDVQMLRTFFDEGRRAGTFESGIQRALEMMLVDPEFLFRLERDPVGVAPATAYQLSDVELASRLSFFLWSSIPDDELLATAEAGRLGEPTVLEAQVRRMLADERSNALMSSFGGQWLHLRRMRTVTPEVNAFPGFDDSLRDALVRETELFVESQFREDRSVVDLLTADYTFVNERLARHYGLDGVYGSRFRRVTWDDEKRRGLLGHGSILTVTSLATRTSPVVRGKWVLENILGTPPPAPPPDVPALPDRIESGEVQSMRARMESHRANPVCASCHSRMDPLGFALEHFDAVGMWRETEADTPIDDSGVLPDGTAFDGLPALRDVLFERRGEFVATVTEKLLTYALGRGVEYYDQPAIRAIVREAEPDDYRWSSLILAMVRSQPFQMRRSES
jgi:mono/diheme cytochrome c family protein